MLMLTLSLPLISIHALLAESDSGRVNNAYTDSISIHALLAESDVSANNHIRVRKDFYPRSPCGERQYIFHKKDRQSNISIHALLAESDNSLLTSVVSSADFYPRSPCGERLGTVITYNTVAHFYPRSPCGERHPARDEHHASSQFLSTLSLRRAT